MSFPDFRMRRFGLAATAAVAAMTMVSAAAAQSMVVRSTGPSAAKYPTGARLKPADKLTLVAGDRIVLMQSGKTRTLSGPGTFGATGTVQASQSLGGNVTRMLAKGPTMRSRGGFSREGVTQMPAELRAPNLWLLDYRERGIALHIGAPQHQHRGIEDAEGPALAIVEQPEIGRAEFGRHLRHTFARKSAA